MPALDWTCTCRFGDGQHVCRPGPDMYPDKNTTHNIVLSCCVFGYFLFSVVVVVLIVVGLFLSLVFSFVFHNKTHSNQNEQQHTNIQTQTY